MTPGRNMTIELPNHGDYFSWPATDLTRALIIEWSEDTGRALDGLFKPTALSSDIREDVEAWLMTLDEASIRSLSARITRYRTGPCPEPSSDASSYRQTLKRAALLLPIADRQRYLDEWYDHIAWEVESGCGARRVAWALLWRSAVPLAITIRIGRMRRIARRTG